MSDWRPIETAPKDGTVVLLYLREKAERHYPADVCEFYAVGLYQHGEWCGLEAVECGMMGGEMTGYMEDWQLLEIEPSHWMPLPAPPEAPTDA